uniref:Ladderlectin-like n=1 Tax=Labrus bergylta TaxID=56723 RepID=A0A3Q3GT51_9LABR
MTRAQESAGPPTRAQESPLTREQEWPGPLTKTQNWAGPPTRKLELAWPTTETQEWAVSLRIWTPDITVKRFFSCPSGWERYRSNCYYFVSSSYTWSGAESYCAGRGATMASASDLFEYTFLQSLTSRGGSQTAWMGGYYFQVISLSYINNKKYKYINQSVYVCGRFNLLCVHVCRTGGGWSNNVCSTSRPFICVRRTDTC